MPFSFFPQIEIPQVAPQSWQKEQITAFVGGLDNYHTESALSSDTMTVLKNLYVDKDGSLITRGPFKPYRLSSESTRCSRGPQNFTFFEISNTDYLVAYWVNVQGKIRWWDNVSAWQNIDVSLDTTNIAELVKFQINEAEDLIYCNGVDSPGRATNEATPTVSDLGLTAPTITATFTEAAATGHRGINENGKYYYKFTYYYDDSGTSTKYGEGGPSTSSSDLSCTVTGAVSAGTTYREVDITSITFEGSSSFPTGVTRVYVYRSSANEELSTYNRVGYFTSGTSFTDTRPVGEEGDACPLDAGTPPKLIHPFVYKGRLWGFDNDVPNKLVWSEVGQPDMFMALNYAYLPEDGTAIGSFNQDIYVFTQSQTFVVADGDPSTNVLPKICDKGCVAHRSVVDVGWGLVWLSVDNVYWADFNLQVEDGDFPVPIGEPVKGYLDDLTSTYYQNASACLYKDRYYLSFTTSGNTTNDKTLCWNSDVGTALLRQGRYGGWSEMDWLSQANVNHKGTLYSADYARKFVQEHDAGGNKDVYTYAASPTTQDIPITYSSKLFYFGDDFARKLFSSLTVLGKSSGCTLTGTLHVNNNAYSREFSITFGSDTGITQTGGKFGTAVFGTDTFGVSLYSFREEHKRIPRGTKGKNFKLTLASTAALDTRLVSLVLYYKLFPSVT